MHLQTDRLSTRVGALDFLLTEIVVVLQLTDTQVARMESAYRALAAWLEHPDSPLAAYGPILVYPQGSAAIGTTVRPLLRAEFDLDFVIEVAFFPGTPMELREPPTWRWGEGGQPFDLIVREPEHASGPPALVVSLSATINPERIHAVDPHLAIWEVAIDRPHNDVLQTASQLRAFRRTVRGLLDRIKARHGEGSLLSVFPAMPVACAVEFGRVRMPKADLPWRVYDQLPNSGFIPALDIPLR